mmetsp:Transcript_29910/g.96513  ORF Transcript_29910/g.96513 Transcript_29910/m.96513 type:complete len:269 (-) Transcript_29910:181-987(-)
MEAHEGRVSRRRDVGVVQVALEAGSRAVVAGKHPDGPRRTDGDSVVREVEGQRRLQGRERVLVGAEGLRRRHHRPAVAVREGVARAAAGVEGQFASIPVAVGAVLCVEVVLVRAFERRVRAGGSPADHDVIPRHRKGLDLLRIRVGLHQAVVADCQRRVVGMVVRHVERLVHEVRRLRLQHLDVLGSVELRRPRNEQRVQRQAHLPLERGEVHDAHRDQRRDRRDENRVVHHRLRDQRRIAVEAVPEARLHPREVPRIHAHRKVHRRL